MINKYLGISVMLALFTGFSACESAIGAKLKTEEFIEVYDVKNADDEVGQGNLTFMESYVYGKNEQKLEHRVFSIDKKLESSEIFLFASGSKLSSGSEYRDKDGQLLSYYKFKYEGDKMSRNIAFDGKSNEVLRIEEYGYDASGNQTSKLVKTADGVLVKGYKFSYDKNGNKSSLAVFDGNQKLVFREEYSITKKDNKGRWIEKWGFRNENPKSFRKRYWKEIKE